MKDSTNKTLTIIEDIHLYKNKAESIVKTLIWIASWMIGIAAVKYLKAESVSSAYFVFALSLLMEFTLQLLRKQQIIGRILHTFFLMAISYVLLISFWSVYTSQPDNVYMLYTSIGILIYMAIDCFLLCICKGNNNPAPFNEEQEKFLENLMQGALGNIPKGR